MSTLFLSFLLLVSFVNAQQNIGIAVNLSEYVSSGAQCLDGSGGLYYIGKGFDEGINKFLIYFQGGGWCSGYNVSNGIGFDSCWHRRTTSLGSTSHDPNTKDLSNEFGMSTNKTLNPTMYNWNHIFVRYCDGGSFSGNRQDPIVNNNEKMYFRGKRIMDAMLHSLTENNNLKSATDAVISGGSAGGLATFLHSNYVSEYLLNLNAKMKIVSLPNVGFFIEYNGYNPSNPTNYKTGMEWNFKNMNVSSSILDDNCLNKLNEQCIFAQNIAGDNVIPTFIFNSQYDSWQTENILGSTDAGLINEFGQNFTSILINNYLSKSAANNDHFGAYINSCHYHDGDSNKYWYGLSIDGYAPFQAFDQFYNGIGQNQKQVFWFHNVSYPCSDCCP